MIFNIFAQGKTDVSAYLPDALWYDFYTLASVAGGGTRHTLSAPLDTIPLLIRGGSIIPTQTPNTTTTERYVMLMVVKAAWLRTDGPVTKHHNAEEQNPWPHLCGNLSVCMNVTCFSHNCAQSRHVFWKFKNVFLHQNYINEIEIHWICKNNTGCPPEWKLIFNVNHPTVLNNTNVKIVSHNTHDTCTITMRSTAVPHIYTVCCSHSAHFTHWLTLTYLAVATALSTSSWCLYEHSVWVMQYPG